VLFDTPELGDLEHIVIGKIDELRTNLRFMLAEPRRWTGLLARVMFARSMQGSNSIEGYTVTVNDAVAAIAKDSALETTGESWKAILGYRDAMTYILRLSGDLHFEHHEGFIRSLHYMLMSHDPEKYPGTWRPGPVFVRREDSGETVYEGAPIEEVPSLIRELMARLNTKGSTPPMVSAAMAHLNLVMIHPFSDGNGRMARMLQTLVLVREMVLAPEFCSIEEYIGRQEVRPIYYDVLGRVGRRAWEPSGDARPFVRFCLTAHYRQAEVLRRQALTMGSLWIELERLAMKEYGLPERVLFALTDAAMGLKVRNGTYRSMVAGLSDNLASRDFKSLVDAGLLIPDGQKRGRFYTAGPKIQEIYRDIQQHHPRALVPDPFGEDAIGISDQARSSI
jgi:Fic family protein